MTDAREVLADFMLQGHLTYRDEKSGWSDYDRATALINDLHAEGVLILSMSEQRRVITRLRELEAALRALANFAALRLPAADVNGPEMQRAATALQPRASETAGDAGSGQRGCI